MRRKLLLADDSITVQRVIELTFADEPLDVSTVGDGGEAITRIERDRPDIVLADLTMPVCDGYGVAEHVKRTPALAAQTRVVLLTGAFEPVDQERAGLLGVDGVLAKPFDPRAAVDMVRALLEKPPQEAKPPVAAGYPFEPGARTPRSTAADLDDYFARLDEALASAGLVASSAVRDMLAESKPKATAPVASPRAQKPEAGPTAAAAATQTATPVPPLAEEASAAPPAAASVAAAVPAAGEGSSGTHEMSGLLSSVPDRTSDPSGAPAGSSSGTLVDAFSALLAAEQGELAPSPAPADAASPTDATTSGPGHAPASPSDSVSSGSVDGGAPTADANAATAVSSPAVPVAVAPSAASAASAANAAANDATASAAPATEVESEGVEFAPVPAAGASAAPASALADVPALADALAQNATFIDAVARRLVDLLGDRIVHEAVQPQVVTIAERLVREEIDRLKAAAEQA